MRLSREQSRTRDIFSHSRAWLFALAGQRSEESSAPNDDLLKILIGVWLCERACGQVQPSPAFHHLILMLEERLHSDSSAGTFNPAAYDTKLLLLSHLALSAHHRRVCALEQFARQLAAAFGELESVPLYYMGEAVLLARLGYGEYPPVPLLRAEDAGQDGLRLLSAGKSQIIEVCDNISAATHFGRQPLRAEAEIKRYLGNLLPVILLQSLREYDLEMGTMLLRVARYLRLSRTRAVRLAVEFLVDQQQIDGRFGYFAIECERIARSSELNSVDTTSRLYLPVTVACLWSLAESLVPGLNLFSFPQRQPI